jgi:hypothetical protein
MKDSFWSKHRYKVILGLLLVTAVLVWVFWGIPYLNECAERGGFMFGGKSELCWTPDGILWPWEIWN